MSIEFCLNIQEVQYLFTDIYRFFCEKELEDKFIAQLCAPIIAAQFRAEFIPESILMKLIRYYEAKKEFKVLEKIILNINVEAYQKRPPPGSLAAPPAFNIMSELEVRCKTHCMVSALLQLQTADKTKQAKKGCTQILAMLLKNMEEKAILEQHERANASSGNR